MARLFLDEWLIKIDNRASARTAIDRTAELIEPDESGDRHVDKITSCLGRRDMRLSPAKRRCAGMRLYERKMGVLPFQRSEEHTSELQSLMRISYAVFCLKKKKNETNRLNQNIK